MSQQTRNSNHKGLSDTQGKETIDFITGWIELTGNPPEWFAPILKRLPRSIYRERERESLHTHETEGKQ